MLSGLNIFVQQLLKTIDKYDWSANPFKIKLISFIFDFILGGKK